MADPTLSDAIAKFKQASILAATWVQGDSGTVITGTGGSYPSLAKLTKDTQDALAAFYINPSFTGKAGFTPPVGATTDRETNPPKGRIRYNSTLDRLESFGPKGWLGLQNRLLATYNGSVGVASGTTKVPFDNTAPLVTEGTQLWSQVVTPSVVGSVMQIRFSCMADSTNKTQPLTLALFKDNTLIGFVSSGETSYNANMPLLLAVAVNDVSASLTPVTYSCRIGIDTSGTWYIGRGQSQTMGGGNSAAWSINEVLP